jgi:GDP-L-fucose synthase
MKIALLGATGFVGKNVHELLVANDLEIHTASRSTGVDLRDPLATKNFFEKIRPDYVVNCAAHVGSLNYVTNQAANVIVDNSQMLIGMYQAISIVCPNAIIINPIANCAYPAKADSYIEDAWWDGQLHRSVLSYGTTRRLMWSLSECYSMQHGIRSISLLVPNMYGPYDSTNPDKAHALNALISKFVKAEHEKEYKLSIWGTGIAIREWLYAPDFAKILLQIIKNPNMLGLDQPINIAQNFGLSVRELVELIKLYFDPQFKIVYDHNKPDGAPKKVMNDTKFRKVFPDFEFKKIKDGIPATIDYYKQMIPY